MPGNGDGRRPKNFGIAFCGFRGQKGSDFARKTNPKRGERGGLRGGEGYGIKMDVKKLTADFCWENGAWQDRSLTDEEKYRKMGEWALRARGANPLAFDAVSAWLLEDTQWGPEELEKNREALMQGIIGRFREQTARLRADLETLEPKELVNPAVYGALERFADALAGRPPEGQQREAAELLFSGFARMGERQVREKIAGGRTGAYGTDTVESFGYLNYLKNCDAEVQWTLFMPELVKRQQAGFTLADFSYRKLPALRFVGFEGEAYREKEARQNKMAELDALEGYRALPGDILLMHHYGKGVDAGPWHGVWGRFFQAGTPVPEGLLSFDFVASFTGAGQSGPPYVAQFAHAVFSGDREAMHAREGFDSDAMYDVTRNVMLGQDVPIPYPEKYWTAEVFPQGCSGESAEYFFSAVLEGEEA